MRDLWRWLGTFLLVVVGCRTPAPDLKPPPQKEEYVTPPENDGRFDKPYQYPKDPNSTNPSRGSSTGNQGVMPIRGPRGAGSMSPGF